MKLGLREGIDMNPVVWVRNEREYEHTCDIYNQLLYLLSNN